ncbi:putative galactosamine-containing minor teichoic acid biosynthesis protein GgaA [Listeria weihenstephanensis FSL R9-0317]|uniref:Glycosyltransferase n=1 Tax=Listeria weihenstephanensis TaxID=1006155 RepID=A0A1S7FW13_9LIST|nr:glycosyltransferase family 2 protein [Listeria weihenstephanensis]AQY51636.1 glycosyltransferase [Listeria weihenstephanensis]EUJ34836.1 putative galactosamine-containing minor teichoic acid biosynthesis protein GgaA [Listeria weihenstephanensis FSL R9-0317]
MNFAIIIPFYNAENRLATSVESIIKQSYGFAENIQILLINDGSTDKSGDIAEGLVRKHPKNIYQIHVKNGGPARARNIGLMHVRKDTDFVGFLDADDVYSLHMIREIANFAQSHQAINMIVPPFYYLDDFGGKQKIGAHKLNTRFEQGSRVINIQQDYKAIHFYIGGTFLRFERLKQLAFDESLRFGEDQLLITNLLLNDEEYGVVADVGYFYYRDMQGKASLVNKSWQDKTRYQPFLEAVYQTYLHESKAKFGTVIPFVQYLISYHAKLYFYKENTYFREVLTESEQEAFVLAFQKILGEIDEKYIWELDTPQVVQEMMMSIRKNGWPIHFETAPLAEVPIVSLHKNWRPNGHAELICDIEESRTALPEKSFFAAKTLFATKQAELLKRNQDVLIWDVVVRPAGTISKAKIRLKPWELRGKWFYQDANKKVELEQFRLTAELKQKVQRRLKLKRALNQ